MLSDLSLKFMGQLVDASIRSLCLALPAYAVIRIARRRSAAARHAIWSVVLGAMLALPVLAPLLPPLTVKIVPAAAFQPAGIRTQAQSSAARVVTRTASVPVLPRWPAPVAVLYLTVALASLVRLLAGLRLSRRLVLRSETVRDQRALHLLEDLAAVQSIPWPLPQLRASHAIAVPMALGAKEPAILLPGDWQSWDDWKLRAVLAHQLAHIRRGDWLVRVAASLNRVLFWFHPLAWWLERRLSTLAEQACDDAALRTLGDAPRYARTLLDFAAAIQAGGRLAYGLAMARTAKVHHRIDRILELKHPGTGLLPRRAWVITLACALPLVYSAAALQVAQPSAEPAAHPGLAQMLTEGSKLSAAEAQELEEQLARGSDDLTIRGKLISYYYAHSMANPFREHVYRLIEQHPESRVALYYSRLHLGSSADSEHIKALWLQEAAAHPENAPVLANAASYIGDKDQFAEEDLLKRARQIDPSNPEWVKLLADLLARAIFRSFVDQTPVVPHVEPTFTDAAKAELETSTDAILVGTVGEFLASGPPGGRLPAQAQIDFAEHLLNRSQALGPDDPEWPAALARLHAAREIPTAGPAAPSSNGVQRIRVGTAVQQSNLLQHLDPVYPPLARQARLQGVVRFNVIIGKDGHMANILLISGHPLLVPAAQEAVKQWVYRPTLLNGDPVEVATVVDVQFTLPPDN